MGEDAMDMIFWEKNKPPPARCFQGLEEVLVNTFCPISPRFIINYSAALIADRSSS